MGDSHFCFLASFYFVAIILLVCLQANTAVFKYSPANKYGLPKWQNLYGFAGFLGGLGVPLPGLFSFLVALLETGGGLLLIVGLANRWVGLLFGSK